MQDINKALIKDFMKYGSRENERDSSYAISDHPSLFRSLEYTFPWRVYRSWIYAPIMSSQMSPMFDRHLQNILW